ncbi:hypothetical protein DFH29DRAFT_877631 [Suillus ampliporus]|nr:hypothetical protein DFH29DRAFT_877631 [Suillus ampliporus]
MTRTIWNSSTTSPRLRRSPPPNDLQMFTPGFTGVHEKMAWASTRKTTRIGDSTAYSLICLFDLSIGHHLRKEEMSQKGAYSRVHSGPFVTSSSGASANYFGERPASGHCAASTEMDISYNNWSLQGEHCILPLLKRSPHSHLIKRCLVELFFANAHNVAMLEWTAYLGILVAKTSILQPSPDREPPSPRHFEHERPMHQSDMLMPVDDIAAELFAITLTDNDAHSDSHHKLWVSRSEVQQDKGKAYLGAVMTNVP